jgi:hypothetical protein
MASKVSTGSTTKKAAAKKAPAKKATKPKGSAATKGAQAKEKPAKPPKAPTKSRAVIRTVEAGNSVECSLCEERIKFRAKIRQYQAICNVYEKGVWHHVEHFHDDCYKKAKQPFGKPVDQ